jgi:transcriptional regulator with PAS, ATPase and Fis domain
MMTRTACALGLAVVLALAQQSGRPPAEPEQPILRVSVNLVQVDAVVTDSDGHQVTNLTADDFEALEDGRLQKITAFSYVKTATGLDTHLTLSRAICENAPTSTTALTGFGELCMSEQQLDEDLRRTFEWLGFVTNSPRVISVLRQARRAAEASDITVLLEGETGTGKQVIAHGIHELDQNENPSHL